MDRYEIQQAWMDDEINVLVATTESFGLGIFKKAVNFVIHYGIPKDMTAFYQVSFFGSSHSLKKSV